MPNPPGGSLIKWAFVEGKHFRTQNKGNEPAEYNTDHFNFKGAPLTIAQRISRINTSHCIFFFPQMVFSRVIWMRGGNGLKWTESRGRMKSARSAQQDGVAFLISLLSVELSYMFMIHVHDQSYCSDHSHWARYAPLMECGEIITNEFWIKMYLFGPHYKQQQRHSPTTQKLFWLKVPFHALLGFSMWDQLETCCACIYCIYSIYIYTVYTYIYSVATLLGTPATI